MLAKSYVVVRSRLPTAAQSRVRPKHSSLRASARAVALPRAAWRSAPRPPVNLPGYRRSGSRRERRGPAWNQGRRNMRWDMCGTPAYRGERLALASPYGLV